MQKQPYRKFLPYNAKLKERARELRHNMTPAEKKLWYEFLRLLPIMVHRQKIIKSYIVDFYIASKKLVIEVDGDSHFQEGVDVYDAKRTLALGQLGLHVMRFTNQEVLQDFETTCETISKYVQITPPSPL